MKTNLSKTSGIIQSRCPRVILPKIASNSFSIITSMFLQTPSRQFSNIFCIKVQWMSVTMYYVFLLGDVEEMWQYCVR